MTQHNLRPQIAIAAALFALGAALAPVSAFAQARNPNDGGQIAVPPGAKLDGGSKAASTGSYYGRNVNDGGVPPEPTQKVSATARRTARPRVSRRRRFTWAATLMMAARSINKSLRIRSRSLIRAEAPEP